jgi:hypothetical protein
MTTLPKPRRRPSLRERLLSKAFINWETGCWEWTAFINQYGYGQIYAHGKYGRQAHRIAFELIEGPIQDGLELDHLCRVRHCINPAHLEPVSHRENLIRIPGYGTKTCCPAGHEYTPENTYVLRSVRHCRPCNRAAAKRLYDRKKAARQEASA